MSVKQATLDCVEVQLNAGALLDLGRYQSVKLPQWCDFEQQTSRVMCIDLVL